MALKTENDLTLWLGSLDSWDVNFIFNNQYDIRDILVRLQSNDPQTRKAAKKKLMNYLYEQNALNCRTKI